MFVRTTMKIALARCIAALVLAGPATTRAADVQPAAQQPPAQPPQQAQKPAAPNGAPGVPAGAAVPSGYVIGPDDVLAVLFWRDKDMSAEVAVRPDGHISLPLINDVAASGLTPEQLRDVLTKEAAKYVEDPNVTVVVKQINSRKVFITGNVSKPGPYPLSAPTTVLQLISMAGGLLEFADSKNIVVLRTENGRQLALRFNYKDVLKRKKLQQNIELKPGDTVVVP
jgi:polysaccharide biosynthesis/export protein